MQGQFTETRFYREALGEGRAERGDRDKKRETCLLPQGVSERSLYRCTVGGTRTHTPRGIRS